MLKNPVTNNPQNPLISVLVYNYVGEYLSQCFDEIFNQDVINNIEVIFIDNASTDGSWDIAVEYAAKYDGAITLKRNNLSGLADNLFHSLTMAIGKYYVMLTGNDKFVPEYVKHCVDAMESDPASTFERVKRNTEIPSERPNIKNKPLVSVLIHNFNYGCYLRQCLDSVISQTYDNIEIVFSDNASEDDSWEIAVEYQRKYPGMMTIFRNRRNFGPNINLQNCYNNINGKYFCVLCSDDAMHPEFIEQCVWAMENNPNVGYTITHRTIIDENGISTEEPPFYNQSCIIPGAEQAAVYMMAAVNPSISQIMYNYQRSQTKLPTENILSRWFAQRILDFNLCCDFDVAYIDQPLLLNRVHSGSDSYNISNSLVEIFGQYILPHQFVEIAISKNNMNKAMERLPQAMEKLGQLCLRYSVNALAKKDEINAKRYFHLSQAVAPDIAASTVFQKLHDYWNADAGEKSRIILAMLSTDNLTTRSISYDPPPGSISIEEESPRAHLSVVGA